jgi:hypothetical protein
MRKLSDIRKERVKNNRSNCAKTECSKRISEDISHGEERALQE